MSWLLIAQKDFEDVVRSRMVWSIVALYAVLMGIATMGANPDTLGGGEIEAVINMFMTLAGELLIPLIALMIGYMAIVGERQSGSLRMLFGLSHSRRDVFVGKLVSRLTLMSIVAVITCALVGVFTYVRFGSLPMATFAQFLGVTLVMAVTFTALAVSISAVSATRMQALGGALGSYVVFALLWHPLTAGVHYLLEGELAGLEPAGWYLFLQRLSPLTAYRQTVASVIDQYLWSMFGWPNIVEDIPPEEVTADALALTNRAGGELPVYLGDGVALLTLLAWIAIPAAVAYWAFERADLN
ncbi:ABC transporter permease [Natronobiforma cellulositropha]|uniref:ABC transporter permease n=1 Tax=Natronobiforma cellulositropha TaxID=1679076 RepID=UPI0021D610ED|nr:ABC transporter permease [Natronobiforma cellulositropha]